MGEGCRSPEPGGNGFFDGDTFKQNPESRGAASAASLRRSSLEVCPESNKQGDCIEKNLILPLKKWPDLCPLLRGNLVSPDQSVCLPGELGPF